jgi:hypothetical protein
MNMSGSHALGVEFVSYVKDNFERMKFRGFVKSINEGECDGEDMKALPSNTVKVISLDEPEEYVQINKIIDNEECRVDESLIVVVEQEDVFESRLNNAQLKSLEYKEPKYNLELGKDNTTATNAVSSFDSNSDLDLEKRVFGSNPISLEKLMDKIPTVKSVKTAKTAKLQQPRKSPTVKTEQQKTVAIETVIQKQEKEELKPLKKYTLLDLQQLSRLHKLPTQKDGTSGKKINKTKEELYTELQKVF